MSQNLAASAPPPALSKPSFGWIVALAAAALLLALFHQEAAAAIAVWSGSTAYGHCFLIAPIAAWLAWERRSILPLLPPRPSFWPTLLALPLIPAWLAADALGIMEGRQLVVLALLQLLALAALGPRLWWRLSPALLYLVFLVPFGAFLTPALQRFTAGFVVHGLALLGIPHVYDGFRITIPEGAFYVAEACAGLRFLIAAIAFGALYAVTMFRSPGRRIIFIAVACLIPILANGVRALGIVVLGHLLGSAEAGATDHILYGWIFFSAVILALALGGLPFREAPAALPPPGTAPPKRPLYHAAPLAVLALAATAPALAAALAAHAPQPGTPTLPALTPAASCIPGPTAASGPVATQAYRCDKQPLTLSAIAFPPGQNPAQILGTLRRNAAASLTGEINAEIQQIGGVRWAVLAGDTGAAAYALWFDHQQRVGSLSDRLALARAMLRAAPAPTGIIVTSPSGAAPLRALLQGAPHFQ